MAHLHIDMVADPVCPWCWLGKRRLDAAIATLDADEITVDVAYRPFELDPNIPKGGVPYRAYMAAKFAGKRGGDNFKPMREHLEAAAPAAGVTFRFDDIPLRPNTLDAHRLIRWAQGQDLGGAAVEALHAAYFDKLEDIGDPAVLVRIADAIGLNSVVVRDLLSTDRDAEAVQAEAAFFRNLGVRAAPTFIADGKLALPGAVETPALVEFLREAAGETA